MENSRFVEVKATCTMERSLYIEVDENASEKEIISKAEIELVYPHDAVKRIEETLTQFGIRTNLNLNLNDWTVLETKMEIKE